MAREAPLARAAMAVLALHVVDDRFLQPEPGTSAGDHLASGLVPLAVLALAAVAYPRMRPGLRAATALTLGVLGATAGAVEAGRETVAVGPSGDDVTGLLALAAGLGLVALGAWVLWTTRRLDETRPRRYARRALVGVVAVVVAYEVVAGIALAYVVTRSARAEPPSAELGAAHEEVTLTTADGLELAAWYVPSRNGAAVIAFPGRDAPRPHARMLVRHGYGVLLLDRRGEGDSEGDPNGLGWDGVGDVTAAVAFLEDRPDVEPGRIGGLGLSVGGELLLEAAARTDGLRAVVSEGAGVRSVREQRHVGGIDLALPQWAVVTAATAVLSDGGPPPDLRDLMPRIAPSAVLLIHASDGQGGEELNPRYFAAAREPKRIWRIDGGHTDGLATVPREYERRVTAFFAAYLL